MFGNSLPERYFTIKTGGAVFVASVVAETYAITAELPDVNVTVFDLNTAAVTSVFAYVDTRLMYLAFVSTDN